VAGVAGDDVQRVDLRIKLTGNASQEADGASDEQDTRRNVADARAEPPAEATEVLLTCMAADQNAHDLQQSRRVGILVHRHVCLAERPGEGLEVPTHHRAHHPLQRGDKRRLQSKRETVVEEDQARAGLRQEVAGVWIGVEDPAPKELVGVGAVEELGDLARGDPGPDELLSFGDPDPPRKLQDEQTLCREILDDSEDEDLVPVGERPTQLGCGISLSAVFEI
jgi:hypothetical protein